MLGIYIVGGAIMRKGNSSITTTTQKSNLANYTLKKVKLTDIVLSNKWEEIYPDIQTLESLDKYDQDGLEILNCDNMVVVVQKNEQYELVHGFATWLAWQKSGVKMLKVKVYTKLTKQQTLCFILRDMVLLDYSAFFNSAINQEMMFQLYHFIQYSRNKEAIKALQLMNEKHTAFRHILQSYGSGYRS